MATTAGAHVTEGKATIYFPSAEGVFYNPPQIPNRDLSVLALRQFCKIWETETAAKAAEQARKAAARAVRAEATESSPVDHATPAAPTAPTASTVNTALAAPPAATQPFRVLDVMTASGLRALRYVLEVPQVSKVMANDVDPKAIAALRENMRQNGISEDVVVPSIGDAVAVMHASKPPEGTRFEAVELDPYGTAAPFLDSAMQCVQEGGLLMVTCTDLAVLAAAYPEKCHANYGSYPLKAKYCHEAALRIVLSCMEGHANRHRRYIRPLLAVHINFYVRLFVRVYTSPAEVKRSPSKLSHIYQCSGCESYALQPLARRTTRNGHEKIVPGQGPPVSRECEHCGSVHHVGGPIWSEPMHDPEFVASLLEELKDGGSGSELASARRLTGMLTAVQEELADVPLFNQLSAMCNVLHVPNPQMVAMVSALMRQGYRVSRSHTDASAIKTDAPNKALWDVLRCWVATQGKRQKALSETSPAHHILAQPPTIEADFRPTKEAVQLLAKRTDDGTKVGRFMPNPDEWGPGSKGISHTHLHPAAGSSTRDCAVKDGRDRDVDEGGLTSSATAAVDGSRPAMLEKRAMNQGRRARKRQARAEAANQEVDGDDDAQTGCAPLASCETEDGTK